MEIALFQNSPSGRLVRAVGGYWAFVPNPLEQGILVEITGGRRNKVYAAQEILKILEEGS